MPINNNTSLLRLALKNGLQVLCIEDASANNHCYRVKYVPNGLQLPDAASNAVAELDCDDHDMAALHPCMRDIARYLVPKKGLADSPIILDASLFQLEETEPQLFNIAIRDQHRELAQLKEFKGIRYKGKTQVVLSVSHLYQIYPASNLPIFTSCVVDVPRTLTYMDKHYPQWEDRMHISESLGLPASDAANFVMNHKQASVQHTAALPDTFSAQCIATP